MSNKQFGIIIFSVSFGMTCLIWSVLMSVMAKDLVEKVEILERELKLYEVNK